MKLGVGECDCVGGWDVKEEVLLDWSESANGVNMFWARMSPLTVLPMVVMQVVRLVLLLRPSFFFFYFCRCQLALAIKILVTLLGVGSKIGQGGGQMIVISKPMVV